MCARATHPRQKILNASLKLFVEKGYFRTNIPSICKLSGCPVGSIYHYFKNKEEIAVELYGEGLARVLDGIERAVLDSEGLQARLAAALRFLVTFVEENPNQARYLLLARHNEFIGRRIPTLINSFYARMGAAMLTDLQQGISQGVLKTLPPEVAVISITAIPLRYCQSWLDEDFQRKPSEVVDELIRVCWDAIRA